MSKTKEEEMQEMVEEFKALPYEMLVASVVLMKTEMIEAYKLLDALSIAVAILIQQAQGGSDQGINQAKQSEGPGQYI